MNAFFPGLLDSFSDMGFIRKVCGKFHYEEKDLGQLRAVAEEMLPLMRREACWEVCAPWGNAGAETGENAKEETEADTGEEETGENAKEETGDKTGADTGNVIPDTVCEGVAITLGKALDCLQESYHAKGLLTESYMLEALASELLLQSYKAYNNYVRETRDRHVARYYFPGSAEKLPLEMLPKLLRRFSLPVSCNEAFCMLPKKSVVFLAELTQDEKVQCEGICVGCGNLQCPNRMEENVGMERAMTDMPLTYGYRRILGKW